MARLQSLSGTERADDLETVQQGGATRAPLTALQHGVSEWAPLRVAHEVSRSTFSSSGLTGVTINKRVRPSTPARRAVSSDDRKPEVCPHQAVRHAAMKDATGVVEGPTSVAEFRCGVVPVCCSHRVVR